MSPTHYAVKTIDELRKVIRDLPDEEMKIEIAEGVRLTAKTVRALRALEHFPSGHEKLRIVTPKSGTPKVW